MIEQFWYQYSLYALIVLIFLFFALRGVVSRWLRKMKRGKVGTTGFEIEFDNSTNAADCEHPVCSKHTHGNLKRLWEKYDRVDEKLDNDYKTVCEIKETLDKLVKVVDEIAIDQLKLVFYNKEMSEPERLIAGLRYVSRGHNHKMRDDVFEFAKTRIPMYRAAITASPSLRVQIIDDWLTRNR